MTCVTKTRRTFRPLLLATRKMRNSTESYLKQSIPWEKEKRNLKIYVTLSMRLRRKTDSLASESTKLYITRPHNIKRKLLKL